MRDNCPLSMCNYLLSLRLINVVPRTSHSSPNMCWSFHSCNPRAHSHRFSLYSCLYMWLCTRCRKIVNRNSLIYVSAAHQGWGLQSSVRQFLRKQNIWFRISTYYFFWITFIFGRCHRQHFSNVNMIFNSWHLCWRCWKIRKITERRKLA